MPPEQIEQMAQNYPDNLMTGYTAAMKREFEVWLAERKNGQSAASGGEPQPGQPSGTAPAAANPGNGELLPASEALKEPLRIMVDITTHRLAVVSGNVLLRSYPVGLGGDRTPEGEFHISEKVRNPNGKDNGTFGSRGMTLSDTLYAIHGTNQPSSIGQDKSLGCIRMLKPDVEELFDMVPIGTKVTIGRDLPLPNETLRAAEPLKLPSVSDETNPNKVYKWLD
jgi:lipoprotein-anchoring transpeptidase ErfK/SrfK